VGKGRLGPLDRIREICLALPEAVEKPFGGHTSPAFRVRDKLFVVTSEDGTSMTLKARPGVQPALVGDDPSRFFVPPYVGSKGWVGIRLDVDQDWDEIGELIEESYRMTAPRRLAAKMADAPSRERLAGWPAMGVFTLGDLVTVPVATRTDLVAAPTLAALDAAGLLEEVGVVEIDPAVSDTAATQETFGLRMETLANCVVVGGKREGAERIAACLVLATTRADVNNVVRRLLDVRKASFLPMERAVELTGMEHGGITPIGLPKGWPVLVDRRVIDTDLVIIGSGVRRSKLLLPGARFADLPGVEVVEELAS
jgi:prolyl-tRNA editing enzyme YbaK/EbsC (Cys-tRNA(Pro) deacylase)/predicted DNA-binding protein (MmcQ/YjbR family)